MIFHVQQDLYFQVTRILARKASRKTHIKESKHLSLFSLALEVLILAVRSGQTIVKQSSIFVTASIFNLQFYVELLKWINFTFVDYVVSYYAIMALYV